MNDRTLARRTGNRMPAVNARKRLVPHILARSRAPDASSVLGRRHRYTVVPEPNLTVAS
jgi:hypothetical protein